MGIGKGGERKGGEGQGREREEKGLSEVKKGEGSERGRGKGSKRGGRKGKGKEEVGIIGSEGRRRGRESSGVRGNPADDSEAGGQDSNRHGDTSRGSSWRVTHAVMRAPSRRERDRMAVRAEPRAIRVLKSFIAVVQRAGR